MTSQCRHKKWSISEDIFRIELKLCTVVSLITKFDDTSTMTFPWQLSGPLFNQRFPSFKKCLTLALVVHSVGTSECGRYTAQSKEGSLDSGVKNEAFFILGR